MTEFFPTLRKAILCVGLIGMVSLSAQAVVARPGLISYRQPDGSTVEIRLQGDFRSHRAYTSDGYLLTTDSDGFYVFATCGEDGMPAPTSIRAVNPELRTPEMLLEISRLNQSEITDAFGRLDKVARKNKPAMRKGVGLFDDTYPVTGNQKGLVILVEFPDVPFSSTPDAHDYFTRMLNEEGFSDNGATGSARDYFVHNSDGQYTPDFDVYGPVVLSHEMSYYGKNASEYELDIHAYEIIIEGCELLDDEIDFSQYDRDGDGVIDNVYVYYAGYGEADGGPSDTIWPHSYNITYCTYKDYTFDGVKLDRYACSNEIDYIFGRTDGIGTFVHEFGHVMGLPDLYDTDTYTSFTPGAWSVMDVGSYNNQSRTPPCYSSFEKNALGWIDPIVLDKDGDYTLEPFPSSGKAYIVKTDNENEFFLFENRQQEGYDKYIPGHGMLIWHIDYDKRTWTDNSINNDPKHQRVDIIEADNVRNEKSRKGDSFPGTSNVTRYASDSRPAFLTWKEVSPGIDIENIQESEDGVISFTAKTNGAGVNAIGNDLNGQLRIENGIVSCRSGIAEVYDLSGRIVAKVGSEGVTLTPGIYIARCDGQIAKFAVK